MDDGGPERLTKLPEVTELLGARAGLKAGMQACFLPGLLGCWAAGLQAQGRGGPSHHP